MSKVVDLPTPASLDELDALWEEQERLSAAHKVIAHRLQFIDRKLSAFYLPKERK